MLGRLQRSGYELSLTSGSPQAQGAVSDPETMVRFRMCTHWQMHDSDIDAFVRCAEGERDGDGAGSAGCQPGRRRRRDEWL